MGSSLLHLPDLPLISQSLHRTLPGVHFLLVGMLIIPVLCDGLGPGIEANAVQTQNMLVAKERVLVAGEGEICGGHGNTHIHTDHAAIGEQLKLPGIVAVLCENNGAVGKGVGVHHRKTLLEVLDAFDEGNGPENLAIAHGHLRCHMVQDGGADKEAPLIAGDHDVPAVQNQLRPLVNALLNPIADRLLVLLVDNGPQVCLGVIGTAHL